jgi:hypothetical protein
MRCCCACAPASPAFDWSKLVEVVQNHVKMLNFRYRVGLKSAQVSALSLSR